MDDLHYNRRSDDRQSQEYRLEGEKRLTEIEHNVKKLEDKIDTLTKNVEDLVVAWKAANFVVGFIKWAGGLSTALIAIYTLIKLKG